MTFTTWLKRQRERDDPIGDLANDVKQDREWPTRAAHYRTVQSYLFSRDACPGAQDALTKAWQEYAGLHDPEKAARLLAEVSVEETEDEEEEDEEEEDDEYDQT